MEGWQKEVERLKFERGLSWSGIAEQMRGEFPELSFSQVREKCRDHIRGLPQYGRGPKLVFSDIHTPFDRKNYPYFLRDVAQQYKTKSVVCLGDLIDSHAISFHQKEPCAYGAYTEYDMAIQRLKIYGLIFPGVKYIVGNHDLRIERVAAEKGIGARFLKPLHEILELPDGWVCQGDEFIEDDVLYCHGINCGGKDGALNKAVAERMSTCIGHYHSGGGVKYAANKRDTVFGMNVGCGVDDEAYAFAYGKHDVRRGTLGCGIVYGADSAIFVPMGREYE